MKTNLRLILALVTTAILAAHLHAGPPLICHPYEIGAAESLPAGEWRGVDPSYDRSHLERDTLALLKPDTPILVRMETLRRAAIHATGKLRAWREGSYTTEDRRIAMTLLKKLRERTVRASDKTRDVALFDVGFFAEILRQTNLDPALDGYALLAKVARLRPHDADIQFALALASSFPQRKPATEEHLEQARNGAQPGSLLAQNLRTHFADR